MSGRERIAADINVEVGLLMDELVPLIKAYRALTGDDPSALLASELAGALLDDERRTAALQRLDGLAELVQGPALAQEEEPAPAPAPTLADLADQALGLKPVSGAHEDERTAHGLSDTPAITDAPPAGELAPDPDAIVDYGGEDGDGRYRYVSSTDLVEEAAAADAEELTRTARDIRAEIRRRGDVALLDAPVVDEPALEVPVPHRRAADFTDEEARELAYDLLIEWGTGTIASLTRAFGFRSRSAATDRVVCGALEALGAVEAGPYKGGMRYALPTEEGDAEASADDPPDGPSSNDAPAPGEGPSEPASSEISEPGEDDVEVPLEDLPEDPEPVVADGTDWTAWDDPEHDKPAAADLAEPTELAPEDPPAKSGAGALGSEAPPALSSRVRRQMERDEQEAARDREERAVPFPPSGEAREDGRRAALAAKVVALIGKEPMTVKGLSNNLFRSRDDLTLILGHLVRVGWAVADRRTETTIPGPWYGLVDEEDRPS